MLAYPCVTGFFFVSLGFFENFFASLVSCFRFVDDARIPLDDNATERGIRGPVVGRRNHFGSKSRRGTEVAATLYTVVETAKLHDIDPAAYIHAAIIAADRDELLLTWQREDLRPRCASRRPPTPSAAALRALIKHVQPVADYFVG